ncbi:MAG: DinB family protein [Planctomycetota bacterium]
MAPGSENVRDSYKSWEAVRIELDTVLANVDPATFEWKPVEHPNVRSIGDLVRHLCDSEAYWIERVIQGKEWIRHTKEVWSDHEALLERWKILRQKTLQFMDGLSTARQTDTKIDHRGNIVTVAWVLWFVFQHEAHHRGQIYMILRLRKPNRTSMIE